MLHVEAPEDNFTWSGTAGYSNRGSKEPLTADQPGKIGSIAKTFVAAAILRLIEMNRLELSQPITRLVHERTLMVLEENEYPVDSITIAHLLSHKSGLPNITTAKWKEKERNDLRYRWTRDEQLHDALRMLDRKPVGSEWNHSDVNYLLLSEIIEQITDTSFYLAMRELLKFDELGMDHTWFYTLEPDPKGTKPRIHQYKESRNWASTYTDGPTWGLYGPSGIYAPPENLVRFSHALFNHKLFDHEETLDMMLSDLQTNNGITTEYIHHDSIQMNSFMGIEHYKTNGINAYGHMGYWGTWMAYFPEENVHASLYVLNGDAMDQFEMKLMREVLDIVNNP